MSQIKALYDTVSTKNGETSTYNQYNLDWAERLSVIQVSVRDLSKSTNVIGWCRYPNGGEIRGTQDILNLSQCRLTTILYTSAETSV